MIKKISVLLLTVSIAMSAWAAKTPGGVTGAKFWLRADTLVTPKTDGSSITAWTEMSGASNTTTIAGTAPIYVSNSNGYPAVRFAGATNIQTATSYNYKTIFWIGTFNTPRNADYKRLFSWNTGSAALGTDRAFYFNTVGNFYLNSGLNNANPNPATARPYPEKVTPSNVYFRFANLEGKRQDSPKAKIYTDMLTTMGFFYNTDNSDIYTTVNGSSVCYTRPHPSGHVWAPVNGKLVIGGYYASTKSTITNSYPGDLYEMIGFDRELTPTETKQVESYIAMKYGVNMVNSKPFSAKITNSEAANSIGKDYLLSDGTIIWPGASESGLDTYHTYFNFLVRDETSDLRIYKSKPSNTLHQWKSNYRTTIFYFDNNVTVANGSNLDAPKGLAEMNYFVMAGTADYHLDSMISSTPYSSTKRVLNGSTYQCWDRVYKMKTKGVDTISIQVDPLTYLENLTANKFGCLDWGSKYGTNPGVLVVSGSQSTFVPGVLESGVLKVKAIPVANDANLYIVFASTEGELKINEGDKNLCTSSSPFQFTASIAGGTWSANAPGGLYTPSVAGVDTITYSYNGMVDSVHVAVIGTPTASLVLDHSTLYNGQSAYAEATVQNAGFHPTFSFGINDSNYSTPSENATVSIAASIFGVGTHTINVKVKPAAACASEIALSQSFTRTNDIKQEPAGVEGATLWMRADKVKTFSGTSALEMENLGESTMRLFAHVNLDTVPAVQTANWMNGQPAIDFGGASFYETDQIKNWKTFFIVHDFRAVSKTSLTMRRVNATADTTYDQGNSECYFFNLSASSGYGWQLGFQREQRVNLFGNNWGVPDNGTGTYVAPSLQYLQERGLGLPIMSTFAKRTDSTYIQSVNGAAALEYTRYSTDGNIKSLDFTGRLFLGAAYKPFKNRYAGSFAALFGKHLNGRIAEFIGFDRYLSAYEISKIESYLAMRYGFSVRGYNADKGTVSNSDYRDYMLSDGTLVYPVASDASLQNYWEQVHFLVRDDATLLHNKYSAPISHGQQYCVSDINPENASVYSFNKLTDQSRGGRVLPAANIKVAAGATFASPTDIATDKAFFAMGVKYNIPSTSYTYVSKGDTLYKTATNSAYKVRVNGIDKISASVGAMTATPFETGAGILQVKDNTYTFNPGTVESGSLIVNGITPVDDAELMVVVATETNPITFGPVTDARKGEVYNGSITASATGSTSFTYQLMIGNLPSGLTMNASGLITGTPLTAGGTSTFTVRATDQRGIYKDQQFSMSVLSDIFCAPVAQPRNPVAAGMVGESTSASIRVPEIAGRSILGVTSGALPAGLSLQSNGSLSGIPEAEGSSKVVVRVKSTEGCEDDVVFDVDVQRATKLHASLVNVYPNPTSGETTITINADLQDLIRMQIFGTNNQLVKANTYSAGTKQIRLDLSSLATGNYFIVLTCQGKKATLPIVVK